MRGELYYNSSDINYTNKAVEYIGDIMQLHFKEPSEIQNPTIYISREYNVKRANYIYIPDLHRYYFITKCDMEHQRYILTCKCDVLCSFFQYLKKKTCISKRSSNKFNLYINDDKLNLRAETRTLTFPFPNGFNRADNSKNFDFILTVNGGGATTPSGGNTNENS